MYYIIETSTQLEQFSLHNYKEAFLEIILFNNSVHPVKNRISLIYIRPLEENKGFMFCIEHSESLNIPFQLVENILDKFDILYVRDKKYTLHFLPLRQLWDIIIPPISYTPSLTSTHDIFYRKYNSYFELNNIIPISKHYEYCEKMFQEVLPYIKPEKTEYEYFFNNRVSLVFNAIERNGIKINPELFEEYFYPIQDDYIYTNYNLKTLTTRPSNHWNGINFAALNKTNHCKQSFIPRNNYLLEIDISAFHPTIISGLIYYVFPSDNIHQHFAGLYGVDYNESKNITFTQLYGGIFEQYKHLEFFNKTDKYIKNLWNNFEINGYVEVPISHYIIKKDAIKDPNPQKLFNWFIQGIETALNVLVLWKIFKLLRTFNTKLIHTVYDSFLFDVDIEEEHIVEEIRKIFYTYNLRIKENKGNNYDF